jgi:delta24-sterol reductase
MDTKHVDTVTKLCEQISEYYGRNVPFRIYHGSTNSTKVLTFKRSEMIDTSDMNRVLSVDAARGVAIVEPNVPMDALVKETLKYGLVPPVVPEFPGITVGGAIQGAAAESSSYRWGCFSQTLVSLEMILGNGEQVTATPDDHADLFYGTAGSYGSLGVITAAEIKLVPAKSYVTVTHYQVGSCGEGIALMDKFMKSGNEFVEFLMFRKGFGSVVVGNMSASIKGRLRHFSRPYDTWYSLYVEATANTRQTITDTLPLTDYLFRYNRGAFWAAQLAFQQSGIPFNRLTRFMLDPLLRTRKLYQALQESSASHQYICQDLAIPEKTLTQFIDFADEAIGQYPIGICPMKPEPRSPLQCNGIDTNLVYNVGVYGLRVEPYEKFVEVNRAIEARTRELGGKKWFYAQSYYTEQEFWEIYDRRWYDNLRRKYHATTLPNIYSRISVSKQRQVSSRRAAMRTVLGRARLHIID